MADRGRYLSQERMERSMCPKSWHDMIDKQQEGMTPRQKLEDDFRLGRCCTTGYRIRKAMLPTD